MRLGFDTTDAAAVEGAAHQNFRQFDPLGAAFDIDERARAILVGRQLAEKGADAGADHGGKDHDPFPGKDLGKQIAQTDFAAFVVGLGWGGRVRGKRVLHRVICSS